MANTTNLDLVKPAGTDHALITVINSNMDKIDAYAGNTNTTIEKTQNGLAYIVGNTNTTGSTLAAGQFVYVKGHSSIAEGLRKVTASISPNGSITTSNTTACSEGGLNALNSNISELSNAKRGTVVDISGYTSDSMYICPCTGYIKLTNAQNQTAFVYVYSSNTLTIGSIGGYPGNFLLYVKKNMKAFVSGTATSAQFVPLDG